MGRIYGGAYRGPDGIYHYSFVDDATGEQGEDLSADPPEMFGPSGLTQADYNWTAPDPWLSYAAGQVGLPLNQPIPQGFTAPGAAPQQAVANAQLGGQPFGQLGAPAAAAARPVGNGSLDFGRSSLNIRPEYTPYLGNQELLPGYIPGSGTYNQFRLDQPGLIGTFNGTPYNARYGLGGTGDPTTGREPQTEARWLGTGGGAAAGAAAGGGSDPTKEAFQWEGNLTGKYDIIPTLFGRSDTPSGIGTPTQNAPQVAYDILYDAIRNGVVRPTAFGWQFLQQTKGVTPNQIGGAALSASNAGAGASQAGAGTGFAEGSFQNPDVMNAITNAAQVAYQRTYAEWQARNGDEQLSLAKAQQAAQEAQFNATLAFQQQTQQQNTGIQAAQLMASLRGPANQFAAANAMYGLNRAGVSNAVSALSGEYAAPSFQAPQALPQAATLQNLAQQLGAAGTGSAGDVYAQAQAFKAGLPAPGKIVGRQFAALSPATQQLTVAGYEDMGYNADDVLNTIRAGLPQFSAPTFGSVG